ncbi:MAG: lipid-A-disaccharide synthase [Pseudomonadota bacterium]
MKLFLTAGEPSGDALGAALIEGLKAIAPGVEFRGVAGPKMQAAGMESLYPMEELSVMGIMEVLPKYRSLLGRIDEAAQAALAWEPDALITIDSPDFSLRVAKRVRAASQIPTIHYVAPSVWAWRPQRAAKMARHIDHVLALLPFEPPYMAAAGMSCDFVGHPVVNMKPVSAAAKADFRREHGAAENARLLAVLPGSRRSEVERLLPVFGDAIAQSSLRNARLVLPTLPHLVDSVHRLSKALPTEPLIVTGEGQGAEEADQARRMAMAAADFALAASGTISLDLAAARTPMVIAYDMNWLSRQIIQRKLLIDTVTLVNLVSETRAVPEFIGRDCTPAAIGAGLDALVAETGPQLDAMEATMARLGEGGEPPGHRAARSVLAFLGAQI